MRRRWIGLVALLLVAGCVTPATAMAAGAGASGREGWGRGLDAPGLPKPVQSAHPDVAPASASSVVSDGFNPITFERFQTGDIVVVLGTLTGHAGLFDKSLYFGSLYSTAVWSANLTPFNGVQREVCLKYRNNPRAYGLRVWAYMDHAVAARNYARSQNGKPYSLNATKTDERSFYCSKLAWLAWRKTAGVDLDADGGYWVWPVDLLNDEKTSLFGYWD